MKPEEASRIVAAAEKLQDASNILIVEIDRVEDDKERKQLRRKFADLIGNIEENFVYEVRKNLR